MRESEQATAQQDLGERPLLELLSDRATEVRAIVVLLAVLLYAVLRLAYSIFYNPFGVTPDELGFGYLDVLVQSAVGTVILLAAWLLLFGTTVTVSVGLFEYFNEDWRRFRQWLEERRTGETRPMEADDEPIERADAGDGPSRLANPVSDWHDSRAGRVVNTVGVYALLALGALGIVGVVSWPVALYSFLAFAVPVLVLSMLYMTGAGLRRIHRGLKGEGADDPRKKARRWRIGVSLFSAIVLGFAVWLLLGQANVDSLRVQDGREASYEVLGIRVTGWGAEEATITWTSDKADADLVPLSGQCLMYLGESHGRAVLYRPSTEELYRIPSTAIALRTNPETCF